MPRGTERAEHCALNYRWFLLIPAVLIVAPQLVTRSAGGDPLFGDAAWVNRGVRIAALCTLVVLAAYLYFKPGSAA